MNGSTSVGYQLFPLNFIFLSNLFFFPSLAWLSLSIKFRALKNHLGCYYKMQISKTLVELRLRLKSLQQSAQKIQVQVVLAA